jgi:hypothetical protein
MRIARLPSADISTPPSAAPCDRSPAYRRFSLSAPASQNCMMQWRADDG